MYLVMRNLLFFISFATIVCFISCDQQGNNRNNKNEIETLPIETFVANFMMDHSNYQNNDVTKEEGDKEFQREFFNAKTNFLKGVPLRLNTMRKNGKKYFAKFEGWTMPRDFSFHLGIEEINCDVVTEVPENSVDNLKEGDYYLLEGTINKRIDFNALKSIFGRGIRAITPLFGLRKGRYDDGYEVNLGMLYFDLDSIKPYSTNGMML